VEREKRSHDRAQTARIKPYGSVVAPNTDTQPRQESSVIPPPMLTVNRTQVTARLAASCRPQCLQDRIGSMQ